MKRLSVCIPTYNGEKYIRDQIASILIQLGNDDEIIISDDSSTDNTVDIIKEFSDNRIHILTDQKFKHWIYNLENALKHVNADYIFLADQDDIWMPNKISIMMKLLQEYDLVISDCAVTDSNLKIIYPSFFSLANSRSGFVKNLIKNTYLGCCLAFNKRILNKSLPFPPSLVSHDNWIGLMAEIYGRIYFVNEKLIYYRRHENNSSLTTVKSTYTFIDKVKNRIFLVKDIIARILLNFYR